MPSSCAATWLALSVGDTTTSRRRPRVSARNLAAASIWVLPAPAAPSMTSSWAVPSIAVMAASWASSNRSQSGVRPGRAACRERVVRRVVRCFSTSRTRWEVRARTCSGVLSVGRSGTLACRARAARSSASSRRTGPVATTPACAICCSTSPRRSGRFHADRCEESTLRVVSTIASRSISPTRVGGRDRAMRGSRKPSAASSSRQ